MAESGSLLAARIRGLGRSSASEDFGVFSAAWGTPGVAWFVGGTDPETYAKAKQVAACAKFRRTTTRPSHRCFIQHSRSR